MTIYTVLEPPDGKPDRVAFVPEGFAWAAFVFTFLWAVWHRMWIVASILFAAYAGLNAAIALEVLDPALGSLVQFGIALLFGFEAPQLKVISLERSGFRRAGLIQASGIEAAELSYFAGLIQASGIEAAELSYFARRAPMPPPAAQPRYRAVPEDTLGIFSNV